MPLSSSSSQVSRTSSATSQPEPHDSSWVARRRQAATDAAARRCHDDLLSGASAAAGAGAAVGATMGATVLALAVLGVAAAAVGGLVWATLLPKNAVQWVCVVLGWVIVAALAPRPARAARNGDAVGLDPDAFPETHALVASLATEIGVKPPMALHVSTAFGAHVVETGWRRRPVLILGLPLWTCLGDDERIALLAHELGHLRGRSKGASVVSQAHRLLGRTATLLTPLPRDAVSDLEDSRLNVARSNAVMNGLGRGVLAAASLPAVLLLLAFERSTSGERHAQAYAADLGAAQVAGTTAAVRLVLTVTKLPGLHTLASAAVRRREDPFDALAQAGTARARTASELAQARTRARAEGLRWDAAHPRDDLRLSVLEAHETEPAVDALTARRSVVRRADDELTGLRPTLQRALRDELLESWM